MIRILIKTSLFLLILIVLLVFYLSVFGIETKRLNIKIKDEILRINKSIKLELDSVKFLLKPFNLSISAKSYGPEVIINSSRIKLEFIKTNISLKSFINNDFSIDDLQISTKKIQLKDLVSFSRSFGDSPQLFILSKIIKDGFWVGDINLNFDDKGKIDNDYIIKGFIKNGKLKLLNNNKIDNLNLLFKLENENYFLEDIEANYNKIKLSSPSITVKKKKNIFLISGKLLSEKKNVNENLLNNLFKSNFKNLNFKNINLSSDNDFTFKVNKKFKINDFNLKSIINLNTLDYKSDLLNIKKYLPEFDELIKLENHKIEITYNQNKFNIKGKGKIIIGDNLEDIAYKLDKKDKTYFFNTNININKNPILIDTFNYEKKSDIISLLNFNGIYKKDKTILFNSISLKENDNKFLVENLKLNKEFKIIDVLLLDFDFSNIHKIDNQIYLKKIKKKYELTGTSFDAGKLIDEMLKGDNDQSFSKLLHNFNTNIDIRVDKVYLDNEYFVNRMNGQISLLKGEIEKLDIKSKYKKDKILTLTINNNGNEKITTLFSDFASPLVKKYKFIKGFEEGTLDFYSIKNKNTSNSKLKIYNFKLQELPTLTKILTLASLQGIADLLTGEGIRFNEFEMSFSSQKDLMTINEIYAIGPAISILMDGYIDKELISLRGTLVPATTINKAIGSIPLLGDILVGDKTGEGVFGVSFKIKGSPKNLKTTVNPIKSLTPRFITRILEKIKKD